jgi:uncharacterized DUF497 family protein
LIKNVYVCHIHAVIDPARCEGFQWDAGNTRKSADKHGVGQAEAEQIFFNEPLLLLDDAGHSQLEARFHALGVTDDGRRLHLSFTTRDQGRLIRIISARDMSRMERTHYGQDT